MEPSKRVSWVVLLAVFVGITMAHLAKPAQTAAAKSFSENRNSTTTQWSVQVNRVDPGNVSLEPSFQIAIYEALVQELSKTKRFKQVVREGDRNAGDISDLLILKTTVQKYAAGSETRRAVTTVSGATKLTVRSQLCTRDNHIILDRTINGNVRFLGSNFRSTHNLARNVANTLKNSSLPEPSRAAPERSRPRHSMVEGEERNGSIE